MKETFDSNPAAKAELALKDFVRLLARQAARDVYGHAVEGGTTRRTAGDLEK